MRIWNLLIWSIIVGMAPASSADLARGLLHADGILSVQGADASEALITVMPADAPTYELARGTTRFMLELKLNNKYMVRFERPGCITKDLYFDTSVPADYRLDEYTFPFEVVLETDARADDKAYAGPVGYIQYLEPVNDFDYVTDYTMVIDARIKEKIDALHGISLIAEHSDPVTSAPPMSPSEPVVMIPEEEDIAEREDPRDTAAGPIRIPPISTGSISSVPGPPKPVLEEASPVLVNDGSVPASMELEEEVENEPMPADPIAARTAPPLPDPLLEGRQEELIVSGNMVTTIIRITNEQGYTQEFRRVAHKFGPVFYFMDGQSIPVHMYHERTGMPEAVD